MANLAIDLNRNREPTEEELRAWVKKCHDNRRFFIEKYLKIKTRDQRIIPLKLNEAQNRLYLQ